ncbi:MAG TPA: hypothetical protein VEY90_06600, partial [Thermoleophilaceae bacterium]|nr:hypothetical protein [Thermoleophilaceae bacterium]
MQLAAGGRYHVRIDALSSGLYGFVSVAGTHAGLVGDNPATAWNEGDAQSRVRAEHGRGRPPEGGHLRVPRALERGRVGGHPKPGGHVVVGDVEVRGGVRVRLALRRRAGRPGPGRSEQSLDLIAGRLPQPRQLAAQPQQ